MVPIRHAEPRDASAIAGIWNRVIRETAVTFNSQEKAEHDVAALVAAPERCVLVAGGQRVVGFFAVSPFRAGPGYRHSVEHTVMLADAARRQGVGRRLMAAGMAAAKARGAHVMVAAISGENPDAVAFHAALGFRMVGRMPEVGRKFDRWLDLVLMQRIL